MLSNRNVAKHGDVSSGQVIRADRVLSEDFFTVLAAKVYFAMLMVPVEKLP